MREESVIKPLHSLCENFKQDVVDGPFGSELQRKDYLDKGFPVLKIQNIKPFKIHLKKMDYVTTSKFQELKRHSYRSGDIVMTKLGSPLGVSAVVEGLDEGLIVADLVRIRAQRINTEYLCYHLNSPQTNEFINSRQKGTTRPRVTLSVVRELPIRVPPLLEQQRIVAILDEAFAGIATAKANAQKNLRNAREVFDASLQSLFSTGRDGWAETTVGSQLQLQRGFDITKSQQRDGIVPVVSSGGIKSRHDTAMVKGPGVVIGRKGTLGKVFFLGEDFWPHDTTLWVKDFKGNHPKFVYYLFRGLDVKRLDSGAANPALNRNQVHPIRITWPVVAEQSAMVDILDALSEQTKKLESIYTRKLTALDALKQSLLHQAFSGQL